MIPLCYYSISTATYIGCTIRQTIVRIDQASWDSIILIQEIPSRIESTSSEIPWCQNCSNISILPCRRSIGHRYCRDGSIPELTGHRISCRYDSCLRVVHSPRTSWKHWWWIWTYRTHSISIESTICRTICSSTSTRKSSRIGIPCSKDRVCRVHYR